MRQRGWMVGEAAKAGWGWLSRRWARAPAVEMAAAQEAVEAVEIAPERAALVEAVEVRAPRSKAELEEAVWSLKSAMSNQDLEGALAWLDREGQNGPWPWRDLARYGAARFKGEGARDLMRALAAAGGEKAFAADGSDMAALEAACVGANADAARALMELGLCRPDERQKKRLGDFAVEAGDLECFKAVAPSGWRALNEASNSAARLAVAKGGSRELTRSIFEMAQKAFEAQDPQGFANWTLLDAIDRMDLGEAREALKKGANPGAAGPDLSNWTSDWARGVLPLARACEKGDEDMVAELLSAGADGSALDQGAPLWEIALEVGRSARCFELLLPKREAELERASELCQRLGRAKLGLKVEAMLLAARETRELEDAALAGAVGAKPAGLEKLEHWRQERSGPKPDAGRPGPT